MSRRRLGDAVDEAAVDLDLVEREAAQIAQRRISGAEIVQRDAHADVAQVLQQGERRVVVADQHGFGDLELQPAGGQAGGRQHLATLSEKAWLLN